MLGKDWEWTIRTKDSTYLKILSRFEDRRAAPFSIHQIALMGASEGKEVGQWFGPNTVAQVLKYVLLFTRDIFLRVSFMSFQEPIESFIPFNFNPSGPGLENGQRIL